MEWGFGTWQEARIREDGFRAPEWALAEQLDRIVPQKELWKLARRGKRGR